MIQRRVASQLFGFKRPHVTRALMMLCGCSQRQRRFFCSSRRRFLCHRSDGSRAFMEKSTEFMENAQILWDYLRIDDQLSKSELMLLLGNPDLRTADYAAQLYHDGLAPVVVVSGNEGHGTKGKWPVPEAVVFSKRLVEQGVPSSQIVMETQATNTGENIRFTQKLLRSLLSDYPDIITPSSLILIQTPFMGRRAYATFMKQWDGADSVNVHVTSPPIPFKDYATEEAGYPTLVDVVVEMVRNMHRILTYPAQGYQIEQDMPSSVFKAFKFLQSALRDGPSFRDL